MQKLNNKQLKEVKAGNMWMLAFPLILQAATTLVSTIFSSIKMYQSNDGSVKVKGYESHWKGASDDDDVTSKKPLDQSFYLF